MGLPDLSNILHVLTKLKQIRDSHLDLEFSSRIKSIE